MKRLATSLLLVALVSGCAHVERRQPAGAPTTPEPSSTPVGWQPTRIRTASATSLPSTDIAAAEPKPESPTTLEAFEELALASNPTLAEFRARINRLTEPGAVRAEIGGLFSRELERMAA